ncbi:hypothetical protein [Planococcus maitriensis]|uniref:N-acetyltransferase domain-containing protein n=1 Tax=Planococcus maitriensis TaxID=221799 RepID=A0A365KAE4_9BACL|nr:hypothetical protein [Planococcus maitriensis]RAZ69739.1 hypothetical protein DP119_03515 [Planococcus maitriensis]
MITEDDIHVDYRMEMRPGTEIFACKADCILKSQEEQAQVGDAHFYLFNPQRSSLESLAMYAEHISEGLGEVYRDLKHIPDIDDVFGLVAVFDDLQVVEGERNKGIGESFGQKMLDELRFLDVELLVVIPGYYTNTSKQDEAYNKKIRAYYKKNGFKRLKKNMDNPVMYTYL